MAKIRLDADDASANGSRRAGATTISTDWLAPKVYLSLNKAREQNSSGTRVEPIAKPSGSAPVGAGEDADVVRHFHQTKQQLMRDDAAVKIDATEHMRYL